MAMSSGINFHGFGNFIIPLSKEFGWSRTTVSAVFSLARLEAGFIGPAEGWAVDRMGPRKLMLVGIPLMGIGFVLLSQVNGLFTFMLVYILGITLGNSLGMHVPASAAVANWFQRKRGLAFGIMWSGVGLGGLLVPALGWAIDVYGWRDASIFVGILVIVIGFPIAALMRHRPEQYGFLPDGEKVLKQTSDESSRGFPGEEADFTAREALQTSSFWYLSLSIMARSLVTGGVGLHLVPYFIGLGASPIEAATYAGSVGVISIPGRFGLSYLGDYFNRRYMMAICSINLDAHSPSIGMNSICERITVNRYTKIVAPITQPKPDASPRIKLKNINLHNESYIRKKLCCLKSVIAFSKRLIES